MEKKFTETKIEIRNLERKMLEQIKKTMDN